MRHAPLLFLSLCVVTSQAESEVPTWAIVMLSFLSPLIALLLLALLFTLCAIRKLSNQIPPHPITPNHALPARGPSPAAQYSSLPHDEPEEVPGHVARETVTVELQPLRNAPQRTDSGINAHAEPPLDPMEQESVDQLRNALPPDAQKSYTIFSQPEAMDNEFFLRFLRARNFDIAKSTELMLSYIKWRQTVYVNGPTLDVLHAQIWRGTVYVDFLDKAGRAVVVLRVKHHDRNSPAENTKQLAVLFLDAALHCVKPHVHQFSVLVDLDGFGYSNADLTALKNCLSLLDTCYPERLGNLWFIHANFLFMNLWKMVKGFINVNTANKIHFFGGDFRERLRASVDDAVLPRAYGGQAPDPEVVFIGRYGPPGL